MGDLPELPPVDPNMQIGYEAIRYVSGYTEKYLKDYARSYALEAVRQEREAILAAIADIKGKPGHSYEQLNTFRDAKYAIEDAIRARSEQGGEGS